MRFSTKTLEFNQIKSQISAYLFSNTAKDRINELIPATNYEDVQQNLLLTNETYSLVVKYGSFPFLENFDNNILANEDILERVYSLDELLYLRLYLKMEQDFKNYYSNFTVSDKIDNLKKLITLNDHLRLNSVFNLTFTDYGEIFDDATKELKDIRNKIKKLQFDLDTKIHKLLNTYSEFLSENIIVTRNNRYCLAVKEGYKNKIKGVIHDISSSKQTVFIEPELSLQLTAEIEMSRILEEKEIFKILVNITEQVNSNWHSLQENFSKLCILDEIHAKAKYSLKINGILPKINNEGVVNLVNAKHPLLDPKIAVPISLKLDKKSNTLLITGPNTGGKTVALKTIGLLSIMVQSGILVPVSEESNFAIFNNIFADIGDEQSIANSLSTFSSHIAKIINFLNNLTDNSLILLDELGSGTDPNEGVALAIAMIEEFNKKDVRLVVTSHYSELKTYAYENDHIKTASVAFDKDSLKPLYYLQHGISGDSHARLISKRLGMNDSVINRANELYARRETDLAKIMAKLNEERNVLLEEQKRLNELEISLVNERQDLKITKKMLIDEQNSTLEKIKHEETIKWQKKTSEIEELIAIIESEKTVKEHHVANLKGAIASKPHSDSIVDQAEKLQVGDTVYIKSYQQHGTIMGINNKKYRVVFGIFDLEFTNKDLEKVDVKPSKKSLENTKKKTSKMQKTVSSEASLSLDLRGYRFEEVHEAIDKAIDRALLNNLHSLTIIHGFGTGAVRKAVYDYIKKSRHIASHRYGGEGEGLNGVTIITLK